MLGWLVRGLSAVEAATATKSSTGPEPVGWTHSAACSGDLFRTTQETNAFVIHKPHSSRQPVPTLRRFLWTHSIDDDSTFSSSQYEVSLLIFFKWSIKLLDFFTMKTMDPFHPERGTQVRIQLLILVVECCCWKQFWSDFMMLEESVLPISGEVHTLQ